MVTPEFVLLEGIVVDHNVSTVTIFWKSKPGYNSGVVRHPVKRLKDEYRSRIRKGAKAKLLKYGKKVYIKIL